jgi:phosphatidylserine/phosphatidylglycerophosphate/cardiolipin synthase-like enzyme
LLSPLSLQVEQSSLALLLGGPAIAAALARSIDGARRRVWVTVPYAERGEPGPDRLLRSMVGARLRGADARLLLGAPPSPPEAAALPGDCLPVSVMDPARCTRGHAKGAVVDGSLIAGSANWSAAGLCGSWEAALLVRDRRVAAYFARSFASDWALAARLDVAPVSSRRARGILGLQ